MSADRLFVPLKTIHYQDFLSGIKEWELRGVNGQFNQDTVRVGRRVELRRGYSTEDSIWGEIADVKEFDSIDQVARELDHRKINPRVDRTKFVRHARGLLEGYDQFIAFRVVADNGGDAE